MNESVFQYTVTKSSGEEISLEEYRGKTLLIVNTASKCGFTPQYEGLQKLYEEYKDRGLAILGFPCDQFAHQEPGTDEEIAEFCRLNFGVTFPLFRKIDVNGKDAHPLYTFLTGKLPGRIGKKIKWNFTKFLIDPEGRPVKRFAPTVKPEDLKSELQPLLTQEK